MDIHFVVCSEIPYRNITWICLNKVNFWIIMALDV